MTPTVPGDAQRARTPYFKNTQPTPMTQAFTPGPPPAPPPGNQSSVAMIARQAIVNAQQVVVGYELFNRSRSGAAHTAATT